MFRHLVHCLVFGTSLAIAWPAFGQKTAAVPTGKPTAQTPSAPNPSAESPLGDAFRSMFNPGSNVKRMGSIQRTNYFEDLLNSRGRLEIAFVIDGTESMGEELAGVQKQLGSLINDFRRVVGKNLAVQMIVYRDVGAASGAITWPLAVSPKSWATEDADITTGLGKLVPESGAPYYYEQVDVGLHTALTELNWSSDTNATRWIFLIGDAPPFRSGFAEEANQAVRKYDTELLKRLAQDKDIHIYGIICPSRPADAEIHQQVLPECRGFFQELADATKGAVLDLADPSQLQEVRHAAELAASRGVKFEPITQADLDRFKVAMKKPATPISVAVLPFDPIRKVEFNFASQMTQLAEEVRSQLDSKGIQTRRMAKVRDAYMQLVRSRIPLDDKSLAQKLAQRLNVDYLICRHQATTGEAFQVSVISAATGDSDALSDPVDPKKFVGTEGSPNVKLCSQVMQSLSDKTKGKSPSIAKVFEGKFTTRLVATTEEGSRQLETARLCLQDSMKKSANSGDVAELKQAIKLLEDAPETMKNDPLLNNLLANAYYGLALQARLQSKKAAADDLTRARKFADSSKQGNLEFQADYNFIHEQYDKAIEKYEEIVQKGIGVDSVCRAHWMLVFLYAGDWGVKSDLVNVEKARQHAISLLAAYPDSSEAAALKMALHWDESRQSTRFNELALEDASPSDIAR